VLTRRRSAASSRPPDDEKASSVSLGRSLDSVVRKRREPMKFICLAYGAEQDWKALSKEEQAELLAHDEVLRKRGALMAAVEPAVTTVRAWDGTSTVTTESFGRLGAPLAGFSIIDADSVEEAVRLVSQTPCARAKGAIEVRPIMFINVDEWKRSKV
jgi:hypothetical protein